VGVDFGADTPQPPGAAGSWHENRKYPLEAEVSKSPTIACNKCHQDSAKQDWVFT
jgi:hypothetical protein